MQLVRNADVHGAKVSMSGGIMVERKPLGDDDHYSSAQKVFVLNVNDERVLLSHEELRRLLAIIDVVRNDADDALTAWRS